MTGSLTCGYCEGEIPVRDRRPNGGAPYTVGRVVDENEHYAEEWPLCSAECQQNARQMLAYGSEPPGASERVPAPLD